MKRIIFSALLMTSSSYLYAASGYVWLKSLQTSFSLPIHISTFILVAVLISITGIAYRSKIAGKSNDDLVIPDAGLSLRNFIEAFGEGIRGLCVQIMGEQRASQYFGFSCFLFLFIFLTNVLGLVPGFTSATDNINTTLALGLFSFAYYNLKGIKVQGLWGHIKHFMGPIPLLAPFFLVLELISHSVRPLSLALRLNGNITGDHMVLGAFSELVPYLVPIPFMVLGIFVCFMQAFVFTTLSIVYVALSTEVHDHGDH